MFPLVRVVEGVRGWRRKAQVVGVFGGSDVRREVCAESETRCAASLGGGWRAYGMVKWSAERASGTPGFGGEGTLRVAL